ncbi:hypothetical protein BJX99DRAFT_221273 [Aspergillus californicus]
MSLCPHRLLLSRFRPRLPSYISQRRQNKLHYQQVWPRGSRYITQNASQPIIEVADEITEASNISANTSDPSEGRTSAIPMTFDDTYIDALLEPTPPLEIRGYSPNNTPLEWVSKTNSVHRQVGTVYHRVPQKDGTWRTRARFVSQDTLEHEISIRSNQLSHEQHFLQRWHAARRELIDARSEGRNPQEQLVRVDLTEKDDALLDKLKSDSTGAFSDAWGTLGRDEKSAHWERLSLHLLYRAPDLLPNFLRTTCQSPDKPDFSLLRDCLRFLNRYFPDFVDQSLITSCLHPETWPIFHLAQNGARLYINAADSDGVYYAWRCAQKKRVHMTAKTYLCFMKRFTEFQDVDGALRALNALRLLKEPVLHLQSPSVIHHCCKLLTLDSITDDANGRNFHILPKMLELGVKPTRDMMNVVLWIANKAGHSEVAHTLLEYMKAQNMELDSYTYNAMITGAIASKDRSRLQTLLGEIQSMPEIHKNPFVFSKILHSHFLSTAKHISADDDAHDIFYSMLGFYSQLHDTGPLKELSIIPQHFKPPLGGERSPPSVVALLIMISTYLRCLPSLRIAERVYHRFQKLLQEGHPAIAPLAATDHTYNEFLVAFRRSPAGLEPSVRLVEDMLSRSHKDGKLKRSRKVKFAYAPPSARTWSLLMSSFVFSKQPFAADRVRHMQSKYGVEPTQDTWNMVVNNYANSQNIPQLAITIRLMEREGFILDEYSSKALGYLHDPDQLWAEIDTLDLASDEESDEGLPGTSGVSDQEPTSSDEALDESMFEHGMQRLKDRLELKA